LKGYRHFSEILCNRIENEQLLAVFAAKNSNCPTTVKGLWFSYSRRKLTLVDKAYYVDAISYKIDNPTTSSFDDSDQNDIATKRAKRSFKIIQKVLFSVLNNAHFL
jgi:hypothetical protein